MNKQELMQWIDANQAQFIDLADRIWENPELSFQEFKSSAMQAEYLESLGFAIAWDIGGMNTAFVAEWGSGKPILGFAGEYDALPGLSQKTVPDPEPLKPDEPGHGCGHNLLGVGCLAAAAAFKTWLENTGHEGTVRYYGCPAEEKGSGKIYIGRAGLFDDLDAAFNFHPWSVNKSSKNSNVAVNDLRLRFHGVSSHAGATPHLGRSALDAVELTNVGINYLREHVTSNVRIHYVITNGGQAPNIVPAEAEGWYYLRAPSRQELDEVTARVLKIAEGAALMTETRLEPILTPGCTNILNNHYLADLQYRNMQLIGPIAYTGKELAFAARINSHFSPENLENFYRILRVPPDMRETVEQNKEQPILGFNFPPIDEDEIMTGSTDVGDMSWLVPLSMLRTACWTSATPGHSWAATATAGMSIGHKGMLHAAKIMALSALDLTLDPAHLEEIRREFEQSTSKNPYTFPIPQEMKPPQYDNPVRGVPASI